MEPTIKYYYSAREAVFLNSAGELYVRQGCEFANDDILKAPEISISIKGNPQSPESLAELSSAISSALELHSEWDKATGLSKSEIPEIAEIQKKITKMSTS